MAQQGTTGFLNVGQKWRRGLDDVLEVWDGEKWIVIGATIPPAEFNYITNGDFEDNVTGWTGSTGFTIERTTTAIEVLSGIGTGKLSKDAANRQNALISHTAFTIENRHKNSTLQIVMETAAGPTYDGSCFGVEIYDVSAAVIIQPTVSILPAGSGRFVTQFATTSSSSYQLRFRVLTTSAIAQTYFIDRVSIRDPFINQGAGIGPEYLWTPTIDGAGTITNASARIFRDGPVARGSVKFTTGTSSAAEARFYLPNSWITSSNIPNTFLAGVGVKSTNGAEMHTILAEPGKGYFVFGLQYSGANGLTKLNGSQIWGNTTTFEYFFEAPIEGWGSNTNQITDFAEYFHNTTSTNANDTTSFGYTDSGVLVPNRTVGTSTSKRVRSIRPFQPRDLPPIEVMSPTDNKWYDAVRFYPYIILNATEYGIKVVPVAGSTDFDVVFCAGGPTPSGAATYGANSSGSWATLFTAGWKWRCRKISNGNMAEQPSTVSCITNNTASAASSGPLIWTSTTEDTHSGLNLTTGEYTVKMAGLYLVGGPYYISGTSEAETLSVYKNNVLVDVMATSPAVGTLRLGAPIPVRCSLNDVLTVKHNVAGSRSYTACRTQFLRIGA